MQVEDYKLRDVDVKGKNEKACVLKSALNEEYEILLDKNGNPVPLGKGGAGIVYIARRASDKKIFVFKEIIAKDDDAIKKQIRTNITNLIEKPLKYRGKEIEALVKPIDVVDLKQSKHFGYIMEYVNTNDYMQLPKIQGTGYLDAEILSKIMMNIACFLDSIHTRGKVYKDLSDGNILINKETGAIRVIDCDNINSSNKYETQTVMGTPGFMAPEIYDTHSPTQTSDYFSMAVFFFKLLVNVDPFLGKKHKGILHDKDGFKQIYSTDILYIFDSQDDSNSIDGYYDDEIVKQIKNFFNGLPKEIKQLFDKTFSSGIRDVSQRATTQDWISVLESIQNTGCNVCPKCGYKNFYSQSKCLECSKKLTPLTPHTSQSILKTQPPPLQNPINIVTFDVYVNGVYCRQETKKSNEEGMFKVRFEKKNGGIIIPYKIHYSSEKKLLGIQNNSDVMWEIEDKPKKLCGKGQTVKLEKDRGIVIKLPPPETKEIKIKILDVK